MLTIFFGALRFDEHIVGEQAVPGKLGHNPDREAVIRVCAAVAILNEYIAPL